MSCLNRHALQTQKIDIGFTKLMHRGLVFESPQPVSFVLKINKKESEHV